MLGGHIPLMAVATYVARCYGCRFAPRNASGRGLIATVSVRDHWSPCSNKRWSNTVFPATITERRGSKGAITAVSGALPCKDGHWVISQIHRPGRWTKFVDWVQDPELSADPSLAEEENQHKRRDFILERLDQWAKGYSKDGIGGTSPALALSRFAGVHNARSSQRSATYRARIFNRDGSSGVRQNQFSPRRHRQVLGNQLSAAPKLGEHNTEIFAAKSAATGAK